MAEPRPICLLIAALGGEGGGVLTDWIVTAAMAQGLPVQSTSIPGVAQRTGATTYYIEIFPVPLADLANKNPLMALYPGPGNIDLMVASELLEVGRALENGYVSPDRTTLIGSTHRIYSIAEKTAMSDARYDERSILNTAHKLSKQAILVDLVKLAEQHSTVINAVILGIIAGTGLLPIPASVFADAVRASGIAVASNLQGFELGQRYARSEVGLVSDTVAMPDEPVATPSLEILLQQAEQQFPAVTHYLLSEGVKRLCDYQDADYAHQYLGRLAKILPLDQAPEYRLTAETGRYLALWMSYEDVIRVADLKTRAKRFQRIRQEVQANVDEPVQIHEVLKPGAEEIAAILPRRLGRILHHWSVRRARPLNVSMRVKSHTISGFLKLRLLAKLRRWRPSSYRFNEEQQLIEHWLTAVQQAAGSDYELALQIVECANLNKGYGETFARGRGNFQKIFEQVITPALRQQLPQAAHFLQQARQAALADPDGRSLVTVLQNIKVSAEKTG